MEFQHFAARALSSHNGEPALPAYVAMASKFLGMVLGMANRLLETDLGSDAGDGAADVVASASQLCLALLDNGGPAAPPCSVTGATHPRDPHTPAWQRTLACTPLW